MTGKFETCGFCQGRGYVYGSMFDREGRRLFTEPPMVVCEYCAGTGECVDGSKWYPAPSREEIIERQSGQ